MGSGGTSRFGTSRLRGMSQSSLRLRALRAVLRTTLLTPLDAHGVERATDDVVANTGEVLDAAATDEDQRVLLQVVADARDIGGHLDPVGEPDARDLAERGIRLLRSLG